MLEVSACRRTGTAARMRPCVPRVWIEMFPLILRVLDRDYGTPDDNTLHPQP